MSGAASNSIKTHLRASRFFSIVCSVSQGVDIPGKASTFFHFDALLIRVLEGSQIRNDLPQIIQTGRRGVSYVRVRTRLCNFASGR